MVPLLNRIPASPKSLLPVWMFCEAHQTAVFSTSPHLQGWKCTLVTLLLGNMLVTHWGAQESRVITRKPVSVVRFQEWGQCQRQEAKLMRSGAESSEEQESNTLPWIGYTEDSSSCALPAAAYINHGIIGTPSRYAVPNLYNHTALLWGMMLFCLGHFCHEYEGGHDLQDGTDTPASSSSLNCLSSEPFHINSLTPSQNYHCVWILGFIQNLVLVSDFLKSSLFPGRKQCSSHCGAISCPQCLLQPIAHIRLALSDCLSFMSGLLICYTSEVFKLTPVHRAFRIFSSMSALGS